MKTILIVGTFLCSITFSQATTLSFEDLGTSTGPVPGDYAGLTWSNWVHYGQPLPPFDPSSGQVRLLPQDSPAVQFGQEVTFIGAWLAGHKFDQYFEGYNNGIKIFESAHIANDGSNFGQYLTVNWSGVDEIRLKQGSPDQTALDDLQYNIPVTITVTNTSDNDPGSLRQALAAANDGDTIDFNLTYPATITLTSGELQVNDSITISGPGANMLTVDGNHASRVFLIHQVTATISGLKITNGLSSGILNDQATLTLSDCTVSGNSGGLGGGIWNLQATLTVTNSTISGNSAIDGGGIYNGGGASVSATLTITNSTISGNSATYNGGGIFNFRTFGGSATLTTTNSTISGNSAIEGGGIYIQGGTLTVTNSTLSGNSATGFGGGIYNVVGRLNLNTSIVGNNTATSNGPDIFATVSSGDYNLVEHPAGSHLSGTHNITGVDPLLGPLQPNGGPTLTHELMTGSPAIDAGDPNFDPNSFTPPLLYDQRGSGFPRVVNCRLDIGAFESATVHQITVDGTNCAKFSSCTATTLGSVTYQVDNHGKTKNVRPPKFMYWVKVTAPAGSNTFVINQSITTGNFNTQFKLDGGGNVFKGSDCKAAMGVHMSQNTTNGANSTVTVTFNAQQAGVYYIAVKFQTGNVGGDPAPAPDTTVHYDFSTTGVPGSTSSVDLVKQ